MTPLEALVLHGIADFVLQFDWMARNKLTNWKVRLVHVLVHGVCFAAWLIWLQQPWHWFVFWLMATHFVIDSQRWCKSTWPPKPIIVDQVMHLAVLALLLRYLPG